MKAFAKLGVIFGAAIVLSGCSTLAGLSNGGVILDVPKIEQEILNSFTKQGTEIETVECPSSMTGVTGDSWLCVATDPWNFSVNVRVTMTSSDGFVEWRVEN